MGVQFLSKKSSANRLYEASIPSNLRSLKFSSTLSFCLDLVDGWYLLTLFCPILIFNNHLIIKFKGTNCNLRIVFPGMVFINYFFRILHMLSFWKVKRISN